MNSCAPLRPVTSRRMGPVSGSTSTQTAEIDALSFDIDHVGYQTQRLVLRCEVEPISACDLDGIVRQPRQEVFDCRWRGALVAIRRVERVVVSLNRLFQRDDLAGSTNDFAVSRADVEQNP
jgi:hypothetical protein